MMKTAFGKYHLLFHSFFIRNRSSNYFLSSNNPNPDEDIEDGFIDEPEDMENDPAANVTELQTNPVGELLQRNNANVRGEKDDDNEAKEVRFANNSLFKNFNRSEGEKNTVPVDIQIYSEECYPPCEVCKFEQDVINERQRAEESERQALRALHDISQSQENDVQIIDTQASEDSLVDTQASEDSFLIPRRRRNRQLLTYRDSSPESQ